MKKTINFKNKKRTKRSTGNPSRKIKKDPVQLARRIIACIVILFLIIKGINAVHQKGVEAKEKIEKSAKKEEAEEPKAE